MNTCHYSMIYIFIQEDIVSLLEVFFLKSPPKPKCYPMLILVSIDALEQLLPLDEMEATSQRRAILRAHNHY